MGATERALSHEPTNSNRQVPFMNLKKMIEPFRAEIDQAISACIDRSDFIRGAAVSRFESEFASWVGHSMHVAGCANGTDAIRLAAQVLQLPQGAEAIVPAMTFVATTAALQAAGLKVRLVDVDESYLLDLAQVREAITPKTRLIVPVHLYGQMVPMPELREIADANQCFLLEDASQAQGALWAGKPVGYWGDIATYSFYPGKNLGAFGDAGAIQSRSEKWVQRCRTVGNQGAEKKYAHVLPGCNSRLDTLQAEVLSLKLKHLNGWNGSRRKLAELYHTKLQGLSGLTLPVIRPEATPVYHQFVILVEDRQDLGKFLKDRNVSSGVHYPHAIHQLEVYANEEFSKGHFPVAEDLARRCLSLPICPTLSQEDVEYVIHCLETYFR